MSKTAVLFPGIGYHTDKPLLYYSAKLATSLGYDVIRIGYPSCAVNLKEATRDQLRAFVEECLKTVSEALKDVDLSKNEDTLFVSKSIGTVIATAYAQKMQCRVRHILFTPLEDTFAYAGNSRSIAFNGTKDNWADHLAVRRLCEERGIPLTTIDGANHSLETGIVTTDTSIMCDVMNAVEKFVCDRI